MSGSLSPGLPIQPPQPIPHMLQISEIRIESLIAAQKAPKGTFNDIYADFQIAPLVESGAINPLDQRRGATGTVSPNELLTTTPAGADPKKPVTQTAIVNVVWYNQDVILQNCRPDWTRLKFAICKFSKGTSNAVEVNQWAEKNPLKRKPLVFGELSVPWDKLPAYANCSEELFYMDAKGNRTYGGRIQFKVTKTPEAVNNNAMQGQGQGQLAGMNQMNSQMGMNPMAGNMGMNSGMGMQGQVQQAHYGSSPAFSQSIPSYTYSTAGGMAAVAAPRNIGAGIYGDGVSIGGTAGGPYGSSLPPGVSSSIQLPYDPTQMFTGGMIRPVTFAQSDFLPEHRKFLTKAAPPPPVRAHPLHNIQSSDSSSAATDFNPAFAGISQGGIGLPPPPSAAANQLIGKDGIPNVKPA
jgi:hypothetical protein